MEDFIWDCIRNLSDYIEQNEQNVVLWRQQIIDNINTPIMNLLDIMPIKEIKKYQKIINTQKSIIKQARYISAVYSGLQDKYHVPDLDTKNITRYESLVYRYNYFTIHESGIDNFSICIYGNFRVGHDAYTVKSYNAFDGNLFILFSQLKKGTFVGECLMRPYVSVDINGVKLCYDQLDDLAIKTVVDLINSAVHVRRVTDL